jgi:hypothetical protein
MLEVIYWQVSPAAQLTTVPDLSFASAPSQSVSEPRTLLLTLLSTGIFAWTRRHTLDPG